MCDAWGRSLCFPSHQGDVALALAASCAIAGSDLLRIRFSSTIRVRLLVLPPAIAAVEPHRRPIAFADN